MDELDKINAEISQIDNNIASVQRLINIALGALNAEFSELYARLPRKSVEKHAKEGDFKKVFRRIASKTHEDKLRQNNLSDEEIESLKTVFNFAKSAYDDEDFETLSYIENSLKSKDIRLIVIAKAKDTLQKKSGELSKLLLSVDYQIALDYLSNDPTRILIAKNTYVHVVSSLIRAQLS